MWQAVLPCNNQRQTTTAVGSKEPYNAQRDAIKLFISHSFGMLLVVCALLYSTVFGNQWKSALYPHTQIYTLFSWSSLSSVDIILTFA